LAALRIDTRHDVPDGPVLSRGVHLLQNQQYGMAVAERLVVSHVLPRALDSPL
jgi:hypothetical protein